MAHYPQDPCYCAVASCAVVANYFNPDIDYKCAKKIADKMIKNIEEEGLDSGDICRILNRLGFNTVTMVSSDVDIFDYTWEKYGVRKMKNVMEEAISKKKDIFSRSKLRNIYKWYISLNNTSIIKIDFNFRKYIIKHLNRKKPVMVSLSWTVLMKFPTVGPKGSDPINGEEEIHSVVLNGYDNKGVWIIDSHRDYYKYKRKRHRKGYYKVSWDTLLTCMGSTGDILLPEDYIGY